MKDLRSRALAYVSGRRRVATSCMIRVDPRILLKVSPIPFYDPSIFMRAGVVVARAYELAGVLCTSSDGCTASVVELESGIPSHTAPMPFRFFSYIQIKDGLAVIDMVPKVPNIERAEGVHPDLPWASSIECPCESPMEQGCYDNCKIHVSDYLYKQLVDIYDVARYLGRTPPHPLAVRTASALGVRKIIHVVMESYDPRTLIHSLLSFFMSFEMEDVTDTDRLVSQQVSRALRISYQRILDRDLQELLNMYFSLNFSKEGGEGRGGGQEEEGSEEGQEEGA